MNDDSSNNVFSDSPAKSSSRRKKVLIVIITIALVGAVAAAVWLLLNTPRPIADNESQEEFMQIQSQMYNQQFVSDRGKLVEVTDDTVTVEHQDGSEVDYRVYQETYYQLGPDVAVVTPDKLKIGSEVIVSYISENKNLDYVWQIKE